MAKYFTLSELTRSSVAQEQGIDNSLSEEIALRLKKLMDNLLDPVREMWDTNIWVTSGYRSPELNAAVGGAARSQHLAGEAADITTGSREGNRRLFEMIVEAGRLRATSEEQPQVTSEERLRATSEGRHRTGLPSHSLLVPYGRPKAEKCSCRTHDSLVIRQHRNLADLPTPPEAETTPSLEFDQLIDERDYSWLHLSYREGKNRMQILHL